MLWCSRWGHCLWYWHSKFLESATFLCRCYPFWVLLIFLIIRLRLEILTLIYLERQRHRKHRWDKRPSIYWFIPQRSPTRWARMKPGIQNPTLVSHVGGGNPDTWAITSCFPGHTLAGSWKRQRSGGLNQGSFCHGMWASQARCQTPVPGLWVNISVGTSQESLSGCSIQA